MTLQDAFMSLMADPKWLLFLVPAFALSCIFYHTIGRIAVTRQVFERQVVIILLQLSVWGTVQYFSTPRCLPGWAPINDGRQCMKVMTVEYTVEVVP